MERSIDVTDDVEEMTTLQGSMRIAAKTVIWPAWN